MNLTHIRGTYAYLGTLHNEITQPLPNLKPELLRHAMSLTGPYGSTR